MYIYQQPDWPAFTWRHDHLEKLLGTVRHQQGRLLGYMEALGFDLRAEATLQILVLDVLKSNEIEGQILPPAQVRSSIARRLGLEVAGLVPAARHVEGVVEMMLDATQQFNQELNRGTPVWLARRPIPSRTQWHAQATGRRVATGR